MTSPLPERNSLLSSAMRLRSMLPHSSFSSIGDYAKICSKCRRQSERFWTEGDERSGRCVVAVVPVRPIDNIWKSQPVTTPSPRQHCICNGSFSTGRKAFHHQEPQLATKFSNVKFAFFVSYDTQTDIGKPSWADSVTPPRAEITCYDLLPVFQRRFSKILYCTM